MVMLTFSVLDQNTLGVNFVQTIKIAEKFGKNWVSE